MSKYLQQLDSGLQIAADQAGIAVSHRRLNVNKGLLVVLVIIPTISGAA